MATRTKRAFVLVAALALLGVGTRAASAEERSAPAPAPTLTAPVVSIHGYTQNRFYAAEGAELEFRSERISLWADAAWQNGGAAHTELYFHPWTSSNGLYVESAYYDKQFGPGRIRVGRGRRTVFGITPAYPNRKTSNYGLVAEAITQDRIQGLQYNITRPMWDLGVGVHTALRPGTRLLGDIPGDDIHNNAVAEARDAQGNVVTPVREGHTVPHLSLRDPHAGGGNPTSSVFPGGTTAAASPNQLSRHLQVAGRLGIKPVAGLSAGVSGSYSHLDGRDFANLRGDAGADNVLRPRNPLTGAFPTMPLGQDAAGNSLGFARRQQSQWGFDAMYRHPSGFMAQGEFYNSELSDVEYSAWNGLVGYEVPSTGLPVLSGDFKVLPGWKFFARYSEQNMDTPLTNNPLSWDTRQVSLSVVQPLFRGVWLQYEYEFNMEETDTGAEADNDVFFLELFTGF